jgi:hypothetical protein
VHSDVLYEVLKVICLGYEITLAADFDHHADFTTEMDVGVDEAIAGVTTGLFRRSSHALLAKEFYRCIEITFGLNQGFLTVHKSSPCAFAQFTYHFCINLYAHIL